MKRILLVPLALVLLTIGLVAQVSNVSRIIYAVDARTIASNGGGTPATLTLNPVGSYVAITCNDGDGCTITMGESGIADGMPVTIVNMSANAITFADTAGVSELTGAASLGQYSTLSLIYRTDRWVEVSRSSGSGAGTVTTTGSPASGNLAFFSGGTSITSGNLSGEVTTSGTGAVTIQNNAVTNARLRDSSALSVIGRSANSSGDPADIAASPASDAVLRESGSTLGFGTLATAGIADNAVTFPKLVNASGATKLLCRGSSSGSGNWQECDLGTNLSMSSTTLSASLSGGSGAFTASIYLQYRDEKTQNTAGGTFTSGAWRTRTLNVEVADAGGLGTLAGNQVTLTAGTYLILATAPGYAVDRNQLRLQNVTDATTVLIGESAYANATAGSLSAASLRGIFTVAASKALELQHQCTTTRSTDGFGVESNFTTEVYTTVELWKIG